MEWEARRVSGCEALNDGGASMNSPGVRGGVSGTLVNGLALLLGIALIAALILPTSTSSPEHAKVSLATAQIYGLSDDIERFLDEAGWTGILRLARPVPQDGGS